MFGVTPHMTTHARERCTEMGISTKVAKRIFRNADITRPSTYGGNPDAMIACSDVEPDYAVLYIEEADGPLIISVLFRDCARYEGTGR